MKVLLLVSLLSGSAMAVDNCYLFERGSNEWASCKETAADSQARLDRWNTQDQQSDANYQAVRAVTAQNESNRILKQINADQDANASAYTKGE